MKNVIKTLFSLSIIILFSGLFSPVTNAQSLSQLFGPDITEGIAIFIPLSDKNVEDGKIVSASGNGYVLSYLEYDEKMYGVVNFNPAISMQTQSSESAVTRYPVVSEGKVNVQVSNANGNIKNGDYVTTSTQPGIGVKATQPGFVLGTALESAPSGDGIKRIKVSLKIHYYSPAATLGGNLRDIFNLSTAATYEKPLVVFKYVIAALILLLSVFFSFNHFGRVATSGIEALGRNPLARRSIQLGIIINTVLTLSVIATGLILAVLILRL